ncbi:MAG: hypothetical protein ACYTFI_13460 [Planctomycetota bacterium]
MGGIDLRVVPEDADEVPDIASVGGHSGLDDAAVDSHPLKELLDQPNGTGTGLHAPHDSPLPEVPEESADTREDLPGTIAGRARARTGRAVSLEQPKRLFVDRLQVATFEFDPDAEVNDSVKVEADAILVVPALQESLLIPIDKVLEGWRPDGRPSANGYGGVMHRIPPLGP